MTATLIADLMQRSGVQFGTSGARGLVSDMSDWVCYAYTRAFIQHLESTADISRPGRIAIAGDLRPSTPAIMNAVAQAVHDAGYEPINCGYIPSPALANFGIRQDIASIMVTGSHIPDDRNGIKYNKPDGEILKPDEEGIRAQKVTAPEGLFGADGAFACCSMRSLPATSSEAFDEYVARYTGFFGADSLAGLRIGLYEHSSVASRSLKAVLEQLGAEVTPLGYSDVFIPVDTEAIRPEDEVLARDWSAQQGFDSIVSTDGDGDRPLISDESGNWLRGDVAGILCARALAADVVVTPVSSNTALEKSGWFPNIHRTRIGSPFVIAGMIEGIEQGGARVVGYEANGGFLTATDLEEDGQCLPALPTRDTLVVIISILAEAKRRGVKISGLVDELPPRFTASGRLKEFPTDLSRHWIAEVASDPVQAFGPSFGAVKSTDDTDGLRITFENEEVVHLRPSGNAPEFRCYNEADTEARAAELNRTCLDIMEQWRQS